MKAIDYAVFVSAGEIIKGKSRFIFLYFDLKWSDRVTILSAGQNISVIGKIRNNTELDIAFTHCELADAIVP